jgi:mRNA deadenylase 3'-5' endonuclease subunit Ccr4
MAYVLLCDQIDALCSHRSQNADSLLPPSSPATCSLPSHTDKLDFGRHSKASAPPKARTKQVQTRKSICRCHVLTYCMAVTTLVRNLNCRGVHVWNSSSRRTFPFASIFKSLNLFVAIMSNHNPQQEWTGRIVARILGPDVEPEYEQTRKPRAKMIVPSSIVPGTGPLNWNPSSPRIHDAAESEQANLETNKTPCVRLDVYLFPKDSPRQVPITVTLQRDSADDASNTLKRLGISISKKLKAKANGSSKKGKNGGATTSAVIMVEGNEFEVSGMTNQQLWTLGLSKPVSIYVEIIGNKIPLHVECNPPTVIGVATFEKFCGKLFPGVPLVIEVESLYATHTIVDWYADNELVCHDSVSYTPTLEDAKKVLSIVITPTRPGHNGEGCEEAYQFQETVEPAIPENTAMQIRPTWLEPRKTKSSELRVLTYNILSDQNMDVSSKADRNQETADLLNRSRRMPLILHEIICHQADVICLQEVDELVYESLLKPVLEYLGYQGYFSVKQTDGTREGCAMFWSLKVFQKANDEECKSFLLGSILADLLKTMDEDSEWYGPAAAIREIFRDRPDLEETILTKLGHVLQIARLRDLEGKPLLLANAHNFFHPIADHVRTLQLFAAAYQLSIEQGAGMKPFVFCGDFNTSLANAARLLVEKCTPKNFHRHRTHLNTFSWMGTIREERYDHDFPELRLPDGFPDVSPGYTEQPEFTHFVVGYKGSLDHIMFTSKTKAGEIKTLRSGAMPSIEQVARHTAMPSPCFPSDHVSLVCDLEWTRRNSGEQ